MLAHRIPYDQTGKSLKSLMAEKSMTEGLNENVKHKILVNHPFPEHM